MKIYSTSCGHSLWLVSWFISSCLSVVLVTCCRQIIANEDIPSLQQFAPCYVHHLLVMITCRLPLVGLIPDQSTVWPVRPQRKKWIHCLPSSGSHLSVPRVMSAKWCMCPYKHVQFLLSMFSVHQSCTPGEVGNFKGSCWLSSLTVVWPDVTSQVVNSQLVLASAYKGHLWYRNT